MKKYLRIVLLFSLLAVLAPAAFAASDFSITGLVHDANGGRIPGAHVAILRVGSQSAIETVTNAQGEFRASPPAPGSYRIEITAQGFAPLETAVELTEARASASLNLTLKVAAAVQSVGVIANALAAETTSTQLGETLNAKTILNAPLNGRSFTDLMAVQPGIVPMNTAQPAAVNDAGDAATPPSGNVNPGNLSISGQRETSNGFRVNGSDVEEDVNMGASIVPNLDSIASFQVLTSNFDAEYGNSSGGQVLVTTQAGTPAWHGSAFEFLRNTALDARNYFSYERAAFRQNQFGGAVGGSPLHKGLAIFTDYQGTRLTEGIDTGRIAVPSLAERGGNFTQNPLTGCVSGPYLAALLSQKLGKMVSANDPYSAQSVCPNANAPQGPVVFANNVIPQSAWSLPARNLLAFLPQPNAVSPYFDTADQAETLEDDKGALRLDWTRGKGTLTAYYFLDGYSLDNPYPTATGGASVPGFDATSNGFAQLASLCHSSTMGRAALNEFHLTYMRNANAVGQPRGGVGPSLVSQGFTGIQPLKPSTEGIENVALNSFTLGVDTTAEVQFENIYEAREVFSRIAGRHGLKAGGEIHSNQINTHPDTGFNGSFSFTGSETGLDFADFLLGTPSSFTQGQAGSFYNRNLYMAAFAQDSWRVAPTLTLNYGVRWDRIRPWQEKYNQLQTLVEGEQSQVFPGAPKGLVFPGDPGVPRSLAPARNDFAPRIGVAWSPSTAAPLLRALTGQPGQTSVRLGYGIFYTAFEGLSAGIMSTNPPYGFTYTTPAPPLFHSPFTVTASGNQVASPFPLQTAAFGASPANPNASVDWSQFEPLAGIPGVDPGDVTPYAEHWMASVERQIGHDELASISYVGTASHHLLVLEEANPANSALCLALGSALCGPFNEQAARTVYGPSFGSVDLQRTIANASYNALEASIKGEMHGLEALVSYTYSKSIDQSTGLPEPVNPVNPSLSRGLSSFDLRHNLVASFHYTLPKVRSAERLHAMAEGWAGGGIARFTSGLPVTLINNNDTSLLGTSPNGINNNGVDTPQWSGQSLSIHTNPRGGAAVFDASQFSLPALGTLGNARRRFFSGPGMANLDANLSKTQPIHDGQAIEFRAEAFNLFNHAQFFGAASVQGNISSSSFGQAVSAMAPRLVQLALRYRF